MKKHLFTMLLLIASSIGLNAQVNIGTGASGTNGQGIPIDPWYGYSYSQMIYKAADINASGTITSLKFYKDGPNLANSSGWTVYLGHTSTTSFASTTAWLPVGGLTQVFSDSVVQVGNEVLVTFTTPFVYNGVDNLVIAVDENQSGLDANADDFYSTASSANSSIYYRNDNTNPNPLTPPTASSRSGNLANVQIGGITQSCPNLTGLGVNFITSTSANANWNAGTVANYQVQYGTTGFTLGTGTNTIVTVDSFNITGLLSNTTYQYYVRNICAAGDTSSWSGPISFTTNCANYVPTYTEDFASYVPECWSEFQGRLGVSSTPVSNATSSSWLADGFANNGSTGSARMYITGTTSDEWLVSPTIDLGTGATPYQLQFDIAYTTLSGTVGSTMGPDDTLAVVISTDNGVTWSQANILQVFKAGSEPSNTGDFTVISLSGYTGLVKFGFYAASSVSNASNNIYIDNFSVTTVPLCPQPTSVAIDSLSSTEAFISWAVGAPNSIVEYGLTGFTPGAGTTLIVTGGADTITGLLSNTTYDFYIQDSCGLGDVSAWTGPITFTTNCGNYIPTYVQDFTNYLPDCWTEFQGRLGATSTPITTPSTSAWADEGFGNIGFTGSAGFNLYGTSADEWLVSPTIDLGTGANPYQVEFDIALTDYYTSASTSMGVDDTLAVVISTDNGLTWSQANILKTFTAGSEPSNTGDFNIIPLTGYTGLVKIGFYGASSVSNEDNNIYIDNFVVTDVPSCPQPLSIAVDSLTGNSAFVSWALGSANSTIEYGLTGFAQGTGMMQSTTGGIDTITGLASATTYDFYVQDSCGLGDVSLWSGPITFTTNCGIYTPTYNQDFTTYPPTCWTEFQGKLGATSTPVTNATSSEWTSDGFGNNGSTGSARMNIYSTTMDEWMVSPTIDLGNGSTVYQLEYDIAYTAYLGTASATMGPDDTLAVVISTDNGLTWSQANILKTYGMGTEPSNTGDFTSISLTGYTGLVKFGFYAASSVTNVDNNVYIDNFSITPCVAPVITTQPVAVTACEGDTASASVVATGSALEYAWQIGGVTVAITDTILNPTTALTDAGNYSVIVSNACGADTSVTVTLTVNPVSNIVDTQVACDSLVWMDGVTYTASNNTATFVLQNAAGCDSIITLDLTINNSDATTDVQVACDSLVWIDGVTYTASNNTATHTLTNAAGCDSIVTLDLTIAVPTSGTDVQVACDTYTWIDGVTYTASNNTATHTLMNAAGCDSIVTLDLTINMSTTSTLTETSCGDYTSPSGMVYSTSGTYTETIPNNAGCDSVITINLTVTTLNTSVTQVDGVNLTSDDANAGTTYKWLDCDNGNAVIAGETNQTFVATTNGNYAVEITNGNCVDTSACYVVSNVGIDENNKLDFITVAPNPVMDKLTITMTEAANVQFEMIDATGKVVIDAITIENGSTIDVQQLERGMYIVRLTSDKGSSTQRVVKN